MNQETKLGLFVLVGICALALTIALLGDFQFQKRYYLNILFNDIAGLPSRAKVKIAGVEVGAVKVITLEGNKAKVTVWLNPEVKIHSDAVASILSTGLIGSKYLELTRGTPEAPFLNDGDTIVGIDPLSFDKIVADAMEQLNSLTKTFRGPKGQDIGENLAMLLENLRKVSDSLRVALHKQEMEVKEIVTNFHSFSEDMAEMSRDNKENLKSAIEGIRNAAEKMDRVLTKIDTGEGTIGKLMSDKEMGEDLKKAFKDFQETSKEAKKALKRINAIDTYWDYSLRYDGRDEIFRNDLSLKLYPKKDKFYLLGVSNAGEETEGVVDPEALNTVNVLIGRKFEAAEVYAGAIRSRGGAGIKVKPLWKWDPWSRLEITAEGYDFFRHLPVHKPKYNLGMRYQVSPRLYVGSQLEDPYHASKVNSYLNINFKDDDIAYILGLVGLAR